MKKLCIACGVEFDRKRIDQVSCGKKCSRKAWKILNKSHVLEKQRELARKKTRVDWIEKDCVECNKKFLPSIMAKYTTKYCSVSCRDSFNGRRYQEDGRKKEWGEAYRERNLEKLQARNIEYKDRIRFSDGSGSKSLNRKATLERDEYTCQRCMEDDYKKLIVHHNTYPATVEHLVTLCRSCHFKIHLKEGGKFYPAGKQVLVTLTV